MTLRKGDLRDLVYHILEIDGYKSKMGKDKDIITISLSAKTNEAAKDLESFIEKGYSFVLDADATSGETKDGTYKIFVEIERSKQAPEQIMELANGIKNLCELDNLKFRYYKEWRSKPLTLEALEEAVPVESDLYGIDQKGMTESNMNNYQNFFNKSFVESVYMIDNMLVVKKLWADPVAFNFVNFGPTLETLNSIHESFNPNDFSEIIFLTKYIGDYNITKYGNKLTFENNGQTLVLERIIL
tara:strand:- start:932 stop:1660 length:729 start_codon:yes stop_codon:yes gene_type:complete